MQTVTDGSVGRYPSESVAARDLDKAITQALSRYDQDPDGAQRIIAEVLAAIRTGEPSKSAKSKRELWVFHEVMCWHHIDQLARTDLGTLNTERGGVPTLRAALTGMFWNNRPGANQTETIETMDFLHTFEKFWESALYFTVNRDTTLFRHPLLQPVAARAYELRNALKPWPDYSPDPAQQLVSVLDAQLSGAALMAQTTSRAFDALAELSAASGEGSTADQLTSRANASRGLSRTPASMSDPAMEELFKQSAAGGRMNASALLLADGVAGFPQTAKGEAAKAMQARGENPTTDVFGLAGTVLGCPAGKTLRFNVESWGIKLRATPALLRAHEEMALLWRQAWEIGTPQLPELDLEALGIDTTLPPDEVVLRDLPNTTARLLPSLSRRTRIATDNGGGFGVSLVDGRLVITGDGSRPSVRRQIDVYVAAPPRVDASGVTALDLEYVSGSTVIVPPGGRVWIRLIEDLRRNPSRIRNRNYAIWKAQDSNFPPDRTHEITSGVGATVTLYGDPRLSHVERVDGDRYVHFCDQGFPSRERWPTVFVRLSGLGQRRYEELAQWDPKGFAALNEELDWLVRQVRLASFDELEAVRALGRPRVASAGARLPGPTRHGSGPGR